MRVAGLVCSAHHWPLEAPLLALAGLGLQVMSVAGAAGPRRCDTLSVARHQKELSCEVRLRLTLDHLQKLPLAPPRYP